MVWDEESFPKQARVVFRDWNEENSSGRCARFYQLSTVVEGKGCLVVNSDFSLTGRITEF